MLNFLKTIYRFSLFENKILFNRLHLALDVLAIKILFLFKKKSHKKSLWLKKYTYGKVTIQAFELDLPNTL